MGGPKEINSSLDIKCIDLGTYEESSEEEKLKIGRQIAKSFQEIGFAYISNHGIPQEVIDRAHDVGAKFFALPECVKAKYSKQDIMQQGFVEIDREKLYSDKDVREMRESYDIRDTEGLFPKEVPNFKSEIKELIERSKTLASSILQCIELGLGIPSGFLSKKHLNHFSDKSGTLLRVLHYPPIPLGTKVEATRCGTHTDYGTFTLLFQDQMGGLEVQNRNGQWIKANPIPGTILINVGDLLQMWTGGEFVATKHRVLVPEEEVKQRCERRSIVLFFHPDDETVVKPFGCQQHLYEPVKAFDHRQSRYNQTYKY